MPPYRHIDDNPLTRLCTGGNQMRLLIAGRTPAALTIPDTAGFDRVAWLAWPGQPAADSCIQGLRDHGVTGLVNLFGMESPGLTSCLAIGVYVANLLSIQ